MAPQELIEALRQKPFEPFRVHVSDGSVYDVRHRDQCMPLRHVAVIAVPANESEEPADRAVKIDVRHITRLEPLVTAVPPSSNGG